MLIFGPPKNKLHNQTVANQGSTDGVLFYQIPIFSNNQNLYRPPILEAD